MAKPFAIVVDSGKLVRADVLDSYATKQTAATSRKLDDRFEDHYDSAGLVKPLYNPEILARTLEVNTFHARCCRTKALDTAGLGIRAAPTTIPAEDADEDEHDRLEAWLEGLDEASPTAAPLEDTLYEASVDFEAVGWGVVEVVRQGHRPDGEPVEVNHLPAHTMRAHNSRTRFAQVRSSKRVWFKRLGHDRDVHAGNGTEHRLGSLSADNRATEVVWWNNYSSRSDFYGLPDIIPALGALEGDLSRRDYVGQFFANHGVPAYAVTITGDYDPGEEDKDGRTELERTIQDQVAELVKRPHSVLVLSVPTRGQGSEPVQIKFEPLSVDVKEASFRLYRKDNRDEILAAHGVDPYRLGLAETGSLGGNTAWASRRNYRDSVIEPRQRKLERLMRRLVRALGIGDWSLRFVDLDTQDVKADLDLLIGLFRMGVVTPRQVAAFFADRFDLDVDGMTHPALNSWYVADVPVAGPDGDPAPAVVARALKALRHEIARGIERSGNGLAKPDGPLPTDVMDAQAVPTR